MQSVPMTITVITVTLNSAATLADTLRSAASQTHRDIEHIIVDGESTDDTLEVIRRHGPTLFPISGQFRTGLSWLLKSSMARRRGHEEVAIYGRADHLCAAPGRGRHARSGCPSAIWSERGELLPVEEKYGNLGLTEIRELRQLRDENVRLKRLVANLTLDKHILGEVVRKKL